MISNLKELEFAYRNAKSVLLSQEQVSLNSAKSEKEKLAIKKEVKKRMKNFKNEYIAMKKELKSR